jgi:biopolymer transport protein ExbB
MGEAGFIRKTIVTFTRVIGLAAVAAFAQEPSEVPPADAATEVVTVAPLSPPGEPEAAGAGDAVTPASMTPGAPTITLWWMLEKGGAINWIILAMSVVALIMAVYLFLTLTPGREVPDTFVKRAQAQIRAGDLRGAWQMCEGRDELIARVLQAGLKMAQHDRYVIQEAMESEGERGATELWQKISYLNNIGVIAPLLGLLGTVWGMIRAFGAIAFEDSQVKSLTMAEGVAQAMITTAAGLCLAIPAMIVYFYLRGRVIRIVAAVEAQATELIEMLARRNEA